MSDTQGNPDSPNLQKITLLEDQLAELIQKPEKSKADLEWMEWAKKRIKELEKQL